MKANKAILKAASISMMATALLLSPVAVFADEGGGHYDPGTLVVDNFNHLYYRPDTRAYWYVENRGYSNGDEVNTRETACANQTCVEQLNTPEDGNFVRLEVQAHNHAGYFTLANLSEKEDGLGGVNNDIGAWTPTVGHPVIVESKLRFAPNMKLDGSGGGTGSAGIFLWNNPYSPSIYSQGPGQDAMGYGWSYNGAALQGLVATIVNQTFPVYINPVQNVDINTWNNYKFVWKVDANGVQSVDFYINNAFVGSSQMPSYSHLSLEVWVDNQQFTFFGINDVPVPQTDYMDLSNVTIRQG